MTLFSRIYGEGEPLLILHGLFGMGDNWITHAKKLGEHFEVHVIDQRNHGQSFHSEDWNYDAMVDDITNYIKVHQLIDVNILGHSMGGKTAMFFSCLNPKLVKKLVIADIAPREYPVHHQEILEALDSLDFDKIHSRKQADIELEKKIKDFGVRQFLLKSLHWASKERLGFRFNVKVIKDKIANVGIALPPNAYFDGPTLFMSGQKSNYITTPDEDQIALHFPNYDLVEIENAGHWLHAEQAQKFYEELIDFLLS